MTRKPEGECSMKATVLVLLLIHDDPLRANFWALHDADYIVCTPDRTEKQENVPCEHVEGLSCQRWWPILTWDTLTTDICYESENPGDYLTVIVVISVWRILTPWVILSLRCPNQQSMYPESNHDGGGCRDDFACVQCSIGIFILFLFYLLNLYMGRRFTHEISHTQYIQIHQKNIKVQL